MPDLSASKLYSLWRESQGGPEWLSLPPAEAERWVIFAMSLRTYVRETKS